MFSGYWRDDAATAAATDMQGWFDTGDLVHRDADGWFYFDGRSKDLIKVGGENVAPFEIEATFAAHSAVQECAVVAKPDRVFSEVPAAFIIPAVKVTAELHAQLLHECNGALPPLKQAREIIFVQELPRSTIRKVAKEALRNWLAGNRTIALDVIQVPPPARGPDVPDQAQIRADMFKLWQRLSRDPEAAGQEDIHFFSSGGDSLVLFEFISLLSERFGVQLDAETVFDNPTVYRLSRHIESKLQARDAGRGTPHVNN